jgi:hypothetical protein
VAAPVAPPPAAPTTPAPGEPDKAKQEKPPASTFAIEAAWGVGSRVDHTSSGYTDAARGGMLFGGGVFFAPSRMIAVGLNYAGMYGAWEQYEPGDTFASTKINRTYHSVLANLRAYPLRSDKIGLWGGLALGATFQSAHATGTEAAQDGPIVTPKTYSVDGGPKAGLALGLSVGVDYDLSNSVGILGSVNFMNHWLTADSLTSAPERGVPGAGTASMFDVRIALQYRFDISGAAAPLPASGSVKTSKR